MGLVFAYMAVPAIAQQFKIVNTAMYEAFLAFDAIQKCEAPPKPTLWADEYKKWVPKFLSGQEVLVASKMKALTAAITQVPAATKDRNGNDNIYSSAFTDLASMYNPDNAFRFNQAALLEWPTTSTANILKRAASCTPTATAPPPPPPTATLGSLECNPYQDSYSSCWNDIHGKSFENCVNNMNFQLPDHQMTAKSPNITQVLREGASGAQGGKGVTYMTNIGWIPGCTAFASQYADNPMGVSGDKTESYTDVIRSNYYGCK